MSRTLQRVVSNLKRPLPDLLSYLHSKVTSALWRRSIGKAGNGFHVCRGAQIQGGEYISIGDGFYAGQLLWIEAVRQYGGKFYTPRIEIGNGVTCSQSVHIAAINSVSIGDNVMFGSRIHVTDHSHGTYKGDLQDNPMITPSKRSLSQGQPVRIERNVWICDGVVILPGVTIGEGSIVGANSVVSRSLPPYVIAIGIPASPIKSFDVQTERWNSISPSS